MDIFFRQRRNYSSREREVKRLLRFPFPVARRKHQTLAAAMPIPATEEPATGHQRLKRSSADLSPVDSLAEEAASRQTKRIVIILTDLTGNPGPSRRSGRSTLGSSSEDATASSPPRPTWVILNRAGARRDYFPGDYTTSVISHTSIGEKVSVSFELADPPGTSVLTVDWPEGPASIYPQVIAADGNLVLFEMICGKDCPADFVDYFIYQASSDPCRRSSLSLLPVLHSKRYSNGGRRPMRHIMSMDATGVLSLRDMFIVAELEIRKDAVDMYLIVSASNKGKIRHGEWKVLKRLPVRCEYGDLDLSWWSTDRVVSYHKHLVWVDYYKGMIFANMEMPLRTPKLRYVPLPVDATKGMCDDWNYGRRCPEAYRNIFVNNSIIKFVTINEQHNSSSVVPLHRCGSTFRITTWSLCDYTDTWIQEATLDAEEFWDLDSENRFPHVVPEFPVFNIENPDAICFALYEDSHTLGYSAKTWMVEVHMKKKLLLNATAYSEERCSSAQKITTKSARIMSRGSSFIASEMPHYLPEEGSQQSKSITKAGTRSALPV